MAYLRCRARRTERNSRDSMRLYSEVVSTAQRSNALKEAVYRSALRVAR